MRSVVPAQITSIEDKLTGNFTIRQFAILMIPLFLGMNALVLLPPVATIAPYKWFVIFLLAMVFIPLVIRVRDKIVIDWLFIYGKFYMRPHYYVYNKNTTYLRNTGAQKTRESKEKGESVEPKRIHLTTKALPHLEQNRIESMLRNDELDISFEFKKKGKLDVIVKKAD